MLLLAHTSDFDGSFPRAVACLVAAADEAHRADWKHGAPANLPVCCLCKRGMAGDALNIFDEMLEREIDECNHVYKTTTSNRHEGCSVRFSQI